MTIASCRCFLSRKQARGDKIFARFLAMHSLSRMRDKGTLEAQQRVGERAIKQSSTTTKPPAFPLTHAPRR